MLVGTPPKGNCPQPREKFQRQAAGEKKKKKLNKEDYSSETNGSFVVEVSRKV